MFCGTYNAFKDYSKGKYKEAEEKLKMEQVNSPFNPVINYNLGVVQYREGKFNDAKESFLRSEKATNKLTSKKSTFNLGNCLYKNTLSLLGSGWEKKKLEDKVLESAINEVKQSIEKYKQIASDEKRIEVNLKHAEELLKKLTEKQQDSKNQPDKSEPDKSEPDQSEPDKSDKDDKKDKQDSDKDKQDNSKDKPDKSDKDQNKDDKDKSKDNQKDKEKQDKSEPDKSDPDESEPDKSDGQDDKKDELDKEDEPDKSGPDQPSGEPKDQELKNMGALLNRLQENEKKLQKALISKQLESNIRKDTNQKNW